MKLRKKFVVFIAVLLMVSVALVGCGGGTQAPSNNQPAEKPVEVKTIRISNGINDNHPTFLACLEFKRIVEEKTNGAIKVEVFHSGQLGDDKTAMEAIQLGTLEAVVTSTSPLVNFIPEYAIFDLPFLFANETIADKVLDGPFGDAMLAKLPSQGFVGLGWQENGFRQVTNSRRAIASLADVRNLKIRAMQNQVHLDAWRALGANPTPMAFTELFTAMQQGTVDGQENPIVTIDLSKYYEVQSHVTLSNHVYTPFVFLIGKDFYNNLTAEQQGILMEAATYARDWQRAKIREVTQSSLENLKANGMTVTELTPEARAEFEAAVKPVIDAHSARIGEALVKQLFEAIEAASK